MKQEPISCRADNALAAHCQSFAARWACVLKRPIFYLAADIDNNGKWSFSLAYVLKPLLTPIRAISKFLALDDDFSAFGLVP